MNTDRRFTLIELLIVVIIIAILAAMLLPVLNQTREKARSIACMNNLKQNGISIGMYLNDYGSNFWVSNIAWFTAVGTEYTGMKYGKQQDNKWGDSPGNVISPVPDTVYFCNKNPVIDNARSNYIQNRYILAGSPYDNFPERYYFKTTCIKYPSTLIFLDEGNLSVDKSNSYFYIYARGADIVAMPHGRGNNAHRNSLFVDGHCESFKFLPTAKQCGRKDQEDILVALPN